MRGSLWHMAGFPVLTVLWPGPEGAEGSARLEGLVEGLQEAEIRCFIEQAIDRGLLPGGLARRAGDVLSRDNRETLSIPTHVPSNLMAENAQGWFARSRRLYSAAAEVAAAVGLDVDRTHITASVAPLGQPSVAVKLRNWTGKPRPWRADSSRKWLVPARTAGTASGFEELPVRLDGRGLPAGGRASGTVTVTDVSSGRAMPVAVTARVGEVFGFPAKVVINAAPGARAVCEGAAVFNSSAVALPFKITCEAGWLRAEPAAGTVPAGQIAFVKLIATAPAGAGAHRVALHVTVGQARKPSEAVVHVITPYRRPTPPAGQAVWLLEALRSKAVKVVSHVTASMTPKNKPRHYSLWWVGAPLYNGHNIPGGPKEHAASSAAWCRRPR